MQKYAENEIRNKKSISEEGGMLSNVLSTLSLGTLELILHGIVLVCHTDVLLLLLVRLWSFASEDTDTPATEQPHKTDPKQLDTDTHQTCLPDQRNSKGWAILGFQCRS